MVRDLAERGVLDGERAAYLCRDDAADISVPGTLQATIAARVDRLSRPAKRTCTPPRSSARGSGLSYWPHYSGHRNRSHRRVAAGGADRSGDSHRGSSMRFGTR